MAKVFGCCVLAFALSTTAAFSQEPGFGVSVAAVGQFPAGDFERATGFGFGGLAGVEFGGEALSITARSGYIQHLERQNRTISFIPILGGLKLSTDDRSVYLAGELGVVRTKIEDAGILARDANENNMGWSAGVGSMGGPFDIRFNFNVWDAAHLKETMTLGVSFGVTVWSL